MKNERIPDQKSPPVLENTLITIHDWFCEDCQTTHRLLGVSCCFSDGMEAYGFCEPKDQMQFIEELVAAHGAIYAEAERNPME